MKKLLAVFLSFVMLLTMSGVPLVAGAVICPANYSFSADTGACVPDYLLNPGTGATRAPTSLSPLAPGYVDESVSVTGTNVTTGSNTVIRCPDGGLANSPDQCESSVIITDPSALIGQNTTAQSATAGCGASNMGGSLGGMSSNLLGSVVNKLLPNSKEGNIVRGVLGGGGVGSAVSQLTGGGEVGNIIGKIVNASDIGKTLNGGIGSIVGGANGALGGITGTINAGIKSLTGGIGSAVGSVFGAGAGNVVSNFLGGQVSSLTGGLLGGGLGAIAGPLGMVAGLLGGSEVPVNDSTVRSQTKQIQIDQDTQLRVTCIENVRVRQDSQRFVAQFTQNALNYGNTGNGGGSIWAQPGDSARTRDTLFNDFINNTLPSLNIPLAERQQLQRTVVQQYQYDTDFRSRIECRIKNASACWNDFDACGSTDNERMRVWNDISYTYPQCNPAGAKQIVQDYIENVVATRAAQDQQYLQQGAGVYPKVDCLRPRGNNIPITECAVIGRVLTTAATQNAIYNEAVLASTRQQAQAKEIGSLVDSLFAELASQALTSLSGAFGLTQKNQNGNGSYLQQAVNNTGASTLAQAKVSLQYDIESSMGVEVTYQAVLSDLITTLQGAETSLNKLHSCYAGLTVSSIESSTPQVLATQASTTVTTNITPTIDAATKALSNSESVLSQLNAYDNQVQAAQSSSEINAIAKAYQALVSSGALHTSTDITLAEANRDAEQLSLVASISQLSSNECSVN